MVQARVVFVWWSLCILMVANPQYDPAGTRQAEAQRPNAVNADMFGGAQARALSDVGRSIQGVGGQMIKIEDEQKEQDDTVKVMDAYTEGTSRMRQALYGEGGIYSRTGTNAEGSADIALATADTIRDDILKRLPDEKTKIAFGNMWLRNTESTVGAVDKHEFAQRQATRTASKTAALANLTSEVIANYNDQEMLSTNFDAARAMIRANPDGLPAELITQMERETISTLNLAVIQRLAQDDPGRALDYYNQHKGQVSGADHATAQGLIGGVAKVREATQAARDIYTSSSGDAIMRATVQAEHHGHDVTDPAVRGRVSSAGAAGPAQLMPDTAREVAASLGMMDVAAMSDAELEAHWKTPAGDAANIKIGGAYMTKMLVKYNGDLEAAMIGYNAGPKNATKWLDAGRDYSVLPKPEETLPYVQRSMSAYVGKEITGKTSLEIQDAIRGGGQAAYFQEGDAKGFLKGKLQGHQGVEHIDGMTGALADRLAAMFSQAPDFVKEGLDILSGTRTVERQRQLWEAELARQGGDVAKARKNVAPPPGVAGSPGSQHNHGNAADLGWKGGKFASAPPNVVKWIHDNAAGFGLRFPMGHEPWHIETKEARSGQAAKQDKPTAGDAADARVRQAFRVDQGNPGREYVRNQENTTTVEVDDTLAPGNAGDVYSRLTMPFRAAADAVDLDAWLATAREKYASNPSLLAEVERQLTDEATARKNAATKEQLNIQTEVFRQLVAGGKVADFDPLQLEKLGPEKVSSLLTLESKLKPGNDDETDPATYIKLSKMSPEELMKVNFLDEVDNLSQADWKAWVNKQAELQRPNASASTRQTDASRSEIITSVQNILGLDPSKDPEHAKRLHTFTGKFNLAIEAFIERNGGKEPTGTEMTDMADQLLVEGTVREKYLFGLVDSSRTLPVFEMSGQELDTFDAIETVEQIPPEAQPVLAKTYFNIYQAQPDEEAAINIFNDLAVVKAGGSPPPPDALVPRITQGLSKTLGRVPKEEEIAAFYREWLIRAQAK